MLRRALHHSILGRDTNEDVHIVEEVMQATDIVEFADRMVSTLSGTQRQRVPLTRAPASSTPARLNRPSRTITPYCVVFENASTYRIPKPPGHVFYRSQKRQFSGGTSAPSNSSGELFHRQHYHLMIYII